MKYLLLVISSIFIIGCAGSESGNKKPASLKYKVGDMVYLKPDSALVLITQVDPSSCACGPDYQYRTKAKSTDEAAWNVNESGIYGLKEVPEQY